MTIIGTPPSNLFDYKALRLPQQGNNQEMLPFRLKYINSTGIGGGIRKMKTWDLMSTGNIVAVY